MPIDSNTLAIMGTIAGSSFLGALWLESRFRKIEASFYRSQNRQDKTAGEQAVRIQRLEADAFGVTFTP